MDDVDKLALPYVLPMGAFLALTSVEGTLSAGHVAAWYPWLYALKVGLVGVVAWACRSTWRDLKPWPGLGGALGAVALGLAVAAVWVGLEGHYPKLSFLGGRTAFDPNVLGKAAKWAFLALRMLGLVVLVPVVEELFWRSFVWRWLIDSDIHRVPIGQPSALSAVATSALFGLAHPEWLPGVLTGLVWAGLVVKTKSISACLLSHAVANLALGIYVLRTGEWKFW
ncbi:MAG: CAAX prenyl protease-related protein [Isosphaeraceae bacterium]|nr:CAAX prenyl protease-related protein [Isosphaeraceae bacterium]